MLDLARCGSHGGVLFDAGEGRTLETVNANPVRPGAMRGRATGRGPFGPSIVALGPAKPDGTVRATGATRGMVRVVNREQRFMRGIPGLATIDAPQPGQRQSPGRETSAAIRRGD